METLNLRKATIEDIDRLIGLRLDYLRTDCEKLSDEQEQTIRTQLQAYFAKHISSGAKRAASPPYSPVSARERAIAV